MRHTFTFLIYCLIIAGCGEQDPPPDREGAATDPTIYARAVANASRPAADFERDEGRKPGSVLEFFGIAPGMTVLDMFSGGGYYAELLSYLVGPEGRVVAHTNEAYARFVGDEMDARYGDDRLPNVEVLYAENNELELVAGEFDAILMILAYHDIYYVSPNNGWPKIDGPGLMAELYEGLKPGGMLGIVDHYAAAGSPRDTGNTLHRIDPEIVISEVEAAGFVLEAKSDVLRNMDDDYSVSMSAPEVRGRTDRFVLRFRKPE